MSKIDNKMKEEEEIEIPDEFCDPLAHVKLGTSYVT